MKPPSEHNTDRVSTPVSFSVGTLLMADWVRSIIFRCLSTARLKFILRWLGCRYGQGLIADGKVVVRVRRSGAITLGDNVTLNSRFLSNLVGLTNPTVLCCIREGRISIGDNSGCSGAVFSSRSSITIGKNVNIGGNVRIYDHDFHALDHVARRDTKENMAKCKTTPIVIGDDVFVGANSIILKGVTIGDRCIIGAGSVVTLRDVPADSLVAGNPARIIRSLTGGPR